MQPLRATAVLIAAFTMACPRPSVAPPPDSGVTEAETPDAGTPDAGATMVTVEIHRIDSWRDDHGETKVARAFDDVEAYYESANGLEPLTVDVRDAGYAVVERPAAAALHLRSPASTTRVWRITDATTIDLGVDRMGRPDLVPASSGTRLAVDWTGYDRAAVSLFSMGPRLWAQNILPVPTTTSQPHYWEFDYSSVQSMGGTPGLVKPGDVLYLYQLIGKWASTSAGRTLSYWSLWFAATLNNVDMLDGEPNLIAADLTARGLYTVRMAADPAGLAFLTKRNVPADHPQTIIVSAWVSPLETNSGLYILFANPIAADFPFSVQFANPFPKSWPARMHFQWAMTIDGARYSATFAEPMVPGSTVNWAPTVAPVTDLRVDGANALEAGGSSVTPAISWSPPEGGADHYSVWLYDSAGEAIEGFFTRGNSVKVPPGILSAGDQFEVYVDAIRGTDKFEERGSGREFGKTATFGVRGALRTVTTP